MPHEVALDFIGQEPNLHVGGGCIRFIFSSLVNLLRQQSGGSQLAVDPSQEFEDRHYMSPLIHGTIDYGFFPQSFLCSDGPLQLASSTAADVRYDTALLHYEQPEVHHPRRMGRTRQTAVNPDNAPIVEAKVTAEDAVPEGTLTEIKSLYLTRDKDGNNQWVVEYPKDAIVAAENGETLKYALLVRNKISTDSRKTLEIDSIIVQSQYLKDALDEILVDYPGITCNLKRLVFRAPFKPFVHRWLDLVAYLKDCKDETTKSHLQLFHDVLFEELKDEIATKNDLVSNGVITFKHLWTIFEPGCLMYGTDYGHERAYEVVSADYTSDQFGREFLRLYSKSVDYDGSKFGSKFDYVNDYEFEGTKSIIKLSYFPLDFHPHKEKVMERLLARGKIFEKYAGYHFEAYKGVALGYGRCGMIKHSVDSRIIIDCAAHNRFLPNRAVTYQALCKAVGGQDDMEGMLQETR